MGQLGSKGCPYFYAKTGQMKTTFKTAVFIASLLFAFNMAAQGQPYEILTPDDRLLVLEMKADTFPAYLLTQGKVMEGFQVCSSGNVVFDPQGILAGEVIQFSVHFLDGNKERIRKPVTGWVTKEEMAISWINEGGFLITPTDTLGLKW